MITTACATCALTTPTPRRKTLEYVNSIIDAVKWLGFDWNGSARCAEPYQASDYFDFMYRVGGILDRSAGYAYVDEQTVEPKSATTAATFPSPASTALSAAARRLKI